MKILFLLLLSIGVVGCGDGPSSVPQNRPVSDLEQDETLVFFNTAGWFNSQSNTWHLPIHGWVYEPQDSTVRKAAFRKILDSEFDLIVDQTAESNFSSRFNLLIADNERGKEIVVRLADRDFALPKSEENGHFRDTLTLSDEEIQKYSKDGLIEFSAVLGTKQPEQYSGKVRLIAPEGLSVISDIDDTVKVSNVTDKHQLLEATFLRDFQTVPGMSGLYDRWSRSGAAFHYVSSSPWQLYQPLNSLLENDAFPWATFSLKSVRFRDETVMSLFKKGTETKPQAIKTILNRYPARQFILVGDSGEQDPEVYTQLYKEHSQQIAGIYIRNVTQEKSDNARFEKLFADIDESRWQLFTDPQVLVQYADNHE